MMKIQLAALLLLGALRVSECQIPLSQANFLAVGPLQSAEGGEENLSIQEVKAYRNRRGAPEHEEVDVEDDESSDDDTSTTTETTTTGVRNGVPQRPLMNGRRSGLARSPGSDGKGGSELENSVMSRVSPLQPANPMEHWSNLYGAPGNAGEAQSDFSLPMTRERYGRRTPITNDNGVIKVQNLRLPLSKQTIDDELQVFDLVRQQEAQGPRVENLDLPLSQEEVQKRLGTFDNRARRSPMGPPLRSHVAKLHPADGEFNPWAYRAPGNGGATPRDFSLPMTRERFGRRTPLTYDSGVKVQNLRLPLSQDTVDDELQVFDLVRQQEAQEPRVENLDLPLSQEEVQKQLEVFDNRANIMARRSPMGPPPRSHVGKLHPADGELLLWAYNAPGNGGVTRRDFSLPMTRKRVPRAFDLPIKSFVRHQRIEDELA